MSPGLITVTRPPLLRRRWPVVALALLVAALVALVPVAREDAPARSGSADFAGSPVHVDPEAAVSLDPGRVQAALGERPVVVGAYPGSAGTRRDVCDDVARDLPDVVVVAYVGTAFPALCAGTAFPAPDDPTLQISVLGSPTDLWLLRLARVAELSTALRVQQGQRDRTVEVEELLLAFDVAVSEDYDDGVPRRPATGTAAQDPRTLGDALPLLAVLAACLVAGGLVLQALALVLAARVEGRRRLRERRAALDVELTRLAHLALRPREAARREHAAAAYVDAVSAFEAARTPAGLDRAELAFQRAVQAAQV